MGTTLNTESYRQLVAEDIKWLQDQPHSVEKLHILAILNLHHRATMSLLLEFQEKVRTVDRDHKHE